jgi:predicted ATPase
MDPGVPLTRSSKLVGRDDELNRLGRLLERAGAGTPATLLLRGEVGAGKSRLLAEFADLAVARKALVLLGSCIAMGSGEIPYAPLVEALRRLVRDWGHERVRRVAGDAYAGLANLVSGLIDGEPGAPPTGLSAQSRVFGAILLLLDRLGTDGPVVLIIEDLQWADPSTLDLLAYLARSKSGERLVLIGSYRTTDLEPSHPLRTLVAELELARKIEHMDVPEFGRPGLRLLLHAILGFEPSHDVIERVLELSDGNAFFVEELLAAGALTAGDGVVTVPRTIEALVLARFATLDRDAKEVMGVAATAGREVSHRAAGPGLRPVGPATVVRAASLHELADVGTQPTRGHLPVPARHHARGGTRGSTPVGASVAALGHRHRAGR